jgi:enoyl-CoA hydratase
MTKRIIRESREWPEAEIWDRQRPLVDGVLASDDASEGARAFAEKRPAQWTGK